MRRAIKRCAFGLTLLAIVFAVVVVVSLGTSRGKSVSFRELADTLGYPVFSRGEKAEDLARSSIRPASSVIRRDAQETETEGEIQVLFAPVEPLNPWGLDDRLVRLINDARQSIFCAFYELQLMSVADALIARHLDGATVRLVSDSHYRNREAIQRCIRAGIPVVFDDRAPFMHNKFCVIDGRIVWTGSTNITENGMYRNNNNAVLIGSMQLAADYTSEFLEMFEKKRFGGRSPRNTSYPLVHVGNTSIECYFAPEDRAQREIVAEVRVAAHTIDFMVFSFTSKEIAEAMAARMKAGVQVRGLFEARNVNNDSCRDDYLRERGAEIHLDTNPYSMHHKVILVDGATVITGSYNFSRNAETQNDENVLIIHDPQLAAAYTAEFERLIR